MFGADEHSQNDTHTNNPMPPEPVDDGTLGVPVTDTPPSDTPLPASPDEDESDMLPEPRDNTPGRSDDSDADGTLLRLKQEALQQLKPLVGHLDQTPEEKFRTTMMMIQASDDQSLISAAYEAAKGISDEKARAQALLDVVNEINYFTSQKD